MHPLSAIADPKTSMRSLRGTVFGTEGDDIGRATAERLVGALGGIVLPLDGAGRVSRRRGCRVELRRRGDRCRRADPRDCGRRT
jgi:hypothetical protein